jgi:hypothetical protein
LLVPADDSANAAVGIISSRFDDFRHACLSSKRVMKALWPCSGARCHSAHVSAYVGAHDLSSNLDMDHVSFVSAYRYYSRRALIRTMTQTAPLIAA